MNEGQGWRRALFVCGVAALVLSFALLVGSMLRPIDPGNPARQAAEMRPWSYWGILSALAGSLLCMSGEGRFRVLCAGLGMILLAWWYGARMVLGG